MCTCIQKRKQPCKQNCIHVYKIVNRGFRMYTKKYTNNPICSLIICKKLPIIRIVKSYFYREGNVCR